MKRESKATEAARRRYDRIASTYDFMESLVEQTGLKAISADILLRTLSLTHIRSLSLPVLQPNAQTEPLGLSQR